jgi:hypothetical protein
MKEEERSNTDGLQNQQHESKASVGQNETLEQREAEDPAVESDNEFLKGFFEEREDPKPEGITTEKPKLRRKKKHGTGKLTKTEIAVNVARYLHGDKTTQKRWYPYQKANKHYERMLDKHGVEKAVRALEKVIEYFRMIPQDYHATKDSIKNMVDEIIRQERTA